MAETTDTYAELDDLAVNTIRTLSMDAVERADSGHPGTPMGLAPLGYVPLHPDHAPQPARSVVDEPRPLRAQPRPRLHAAVLAAAPVRVRPSPSTT